MKAFLVGLVAAFIAMTVVSQGPGKGSWKGVIASQAEPGERIRVNGRVLSAEGTAVVNAKVYAYHTDVKGLYNNAPKQAGAPRLRLDLWTDAKGRFQFETIKPGQYPNGRGPIHIHLEITPAGGQKYLHDLWFADDPAISMSESKRAIKEGRVTVLSLKKGAAGIKEAVCELRMPTKDRLIARP